jgi:hypothetical protein
MAPIRAGFIRLSYNRGWANTLMLQMTPEPPAIYNSTLESAHKAIKEYKVPTVTKFYDNFEGRAVQNQCFSLYLKYYKQC